MARAFAKLVDDRNRAMADHNLDFAEHVDPQRVGPDFLERRRTGNATRVRMERLFVEVNSQSAARLAECLAPAPAAAFLAAFKSASYPQVHPNPFEIQPIVAELTTSPAIDERTRAELLPVVDALRRQAAAINDRMERPCIDVWTERALTHVGPAGLTMPQRIAKARAPMDVQRRALAAQAVALRRAENVIDGLPTAPALEPKVVEAPAAPGRTPSCMFANEARRAILLRLTHNRRRACATCCPGIRRSHRSVSRTSCAIFAQLRLRIGAPARPSRITASAALE